MEQSDFQFIFFYDRLNQNGSMYRKSFKNTTYAIRNSIDYFDLLASINPRSYFLILNKSPAVKPVPNASALINKKNGDRMATIGSFRNAL